MEPTIYEDSVLAQPAQRRRIPGPDARAYTPSQTENTLLSMMNQQGANQLIGFLAQARGDQQNAIGMQDAALRNQQMLQRQSDAERAQLDRRRADISLLSAMTNNGLDAVLGSPIAAELIPASSRNPTIEGLRARRQAQIDEDNRSNRGGGAASGDINESRLQPIIADAQRQARAAGNDAVRTFLAGRGYDPRTIDQFGIVTPIPGSRAPDPALIAQARQIREAAARQALMDRLQLLPESARNTVLQRMGQPAPQAAAPAPTQPAQQPTAPVETPRPAAPAAAPMTQQRAAVLAAEAGGTLVRNSAGQYGIRMPDGTVRPIQ